MNELLTKFDAWLQPNGPAALVIREHLMPVEGDDGVVFPATFAAAEDKSKFAGGYNIDAHGDGRNVCLIDSVGSQANRIEPMFKEQEYAALVPQITVVAGSHSVNLLDAGHRAGDAIVRCSALQQELQTAFKAVQKGNAGPLAKLAPTSLVFGVWDSRDTQAKLPRLIASTIRAFNVHKLTRSAQYIPATEYVDDGLLEDTDDKKTKDAYAERGFVHVPATGSHGGVIASAGIRRDASLSLSALRLLNAGEGESRGNESLKLRRYILGLALTAFTHSSTGYLRQGCNLVLHPEKPRVCEVVFHDGHREDAALTHGDALAFAMVAAETFGVGDNRVVQFDVELAKRDIAGENHDAKPTKKSPKKKV